MVYLYIAGAFIVVPLAWISLKLAPWAAPLAGVLGLAVGIGSTLMGYSHGMLWGFGLFGFSSFLFVAGGGMRGR